MAAKALFLDRDGVVNIDTGYTHRADDFTLIDGITDLCRAAKEKGYLVIIVTNQSGIGRGMFTEADFFALMAYVKELFIAAGADIDDVFFCPSLSDEDPDRKPNSGMFRKAAAKHAIDMAASLSVGDRERDVTAALSAGVGKNFLFCPKDNPYSDADDAPTRATARVASLREIIAWL